MGAQSVLLQFEDVTVPKPRVPYQCLFFSLTKVAKASLRKDVGHPIACETR